jgi:hypothetical protein
MKIYTDKSLFDVEMTKEELDYLVWVVGVIDVDEEAAAGYDTAYTAVIFGDLLDIQDALGG